MAQDEIDNNTSTTATMKTENQSTDPSPSSFKIYPTPQQKKIIWKALTGIAISVIGCLLVFLIWLIGSVFSFLQPVLVPLAIAGVIAYLLDPLVMWLQVKKRISRLKSVLIVFASFVLVIITLAMIVIPPIAKQIGDDDQRSRIGESVRRTMLSLGDTPWVEPFVNKALEEHQDPLELEAALTNGKSITEPVQAEKFSDTYLAHKLGENADKIANLAFNFITSSTSTIVGLLGLIIGLAMVPIYLYYFLKEGSAIKQNWTKYVPLKRSAFKTEVVETLSEINGYLISFFRGQVLVALIDGLLVGVALAIFQLPYGILIGLILAIIGVIPFIGNLLCLIPACFIAYVHFSNPAVDTHQWLLGDNPWAYVGAVAGIFIVVQQINSLVTAPKIVGESVGLHPMTVIFSMLFWSLILGGFLGALLAVPMTAAVKVLFRRYVWENKIKAPLVKKEQAKIEAEQEAPASA